MNIKYWLGSALMLPLLPVMYWQGWNIRKNVPVLPEADGPVGFVNKESKRQITILYLGESTIAGVGVKTHKEGFSGTLSDLIAENLNSNVAWRVYAKSGYTARSTREKIIPRITETTADLIVIGLGGNDAFKLNTPWSWRDQVRALIMELKQKFPTAPIVFLNMPPIKEFPAFTNLIRFSIGNLVEILGNELTEVRKEFDQVYYHSTIITLKDWMTRLNIDVKKSDFFSDGVHPSKITYQTWAKDVARFIFDKKVIGGI